MDSCGCKVNKVMTYFNLEFNYLAIEMYPSLTLCIFLSGTSALSSSTDVATSFEGICSRESNKTKR